MTFFVKLSGFETKEQAEAFLEWFEEEGEQSRGISQYVGAEVAVDLTNGMIHHEDGVEYQVKIFD